LAGTRFFSRALPTNSTSPVSASETCQMCFAASDSLEPAQTGRRGSPILNLAWAKPGQVPYNKPLERAGMTVSRPAERASAGRSAPVRYAEFA
jgi:hypothetical protein